MEVKVSIAQTNKYAVSHCGDSVDVVERPQGGVSLVLADGQGSGKSAKTTSSLVVNKAISLIADGTRDGAVARSAHDYLYVLKDGKVSSTLTLISADFATDTVVISRNSNCPVIMKDEFGITFYNENVNSIGVHRSMKPLIYQVPLIEGSIFISYTDGIQAAGKKYGKEIDVDYLKKIIMENSADDTDFIANTILEYALNLDQNRAGDDMTIAVMSIRKKKTENKIKYVNVSYPY